MKLTEVETGQQGLMAGLRFESSEAYATFGGFQGPGPVTEVLTMTGTSAIASVIASIVLTTSAPVTAVIVTALFAFSVIMMRTPSLGATYELHLYWCRMGLM